MWVKGNEGDRYNRVGVFEADIAADEGAWDVAVGARGADACVAAVHHESAAAGRQLLVPHGGEARECLEDGLLPGSPSAGTRRMQGCLAIDSSPESPLTFVNRKVKIYANCLEHHAPAE